MKKRIMLLLVMISILFGPKVYAEELALVSSETKYYKTVDTGTNLMSKTSPSVYTVEISEEEYNSYRPGLEPQNSVTGSTEYKRLTSSIYENGSIYRYQAELDWKKIPKVRSYDIIGIGFNASVKVNFGIHYTTNYCVTGGSCTTLRAYDPYISSTGASAVFKVPDGNLSSLTSVLYFDVSKNTTSTIISQRAVADYSHATKTVTHTQAAKHSVNLSGISLNSSIVNYYDAISPVKATWSGNW